MATVRPKPDAPLRRPKWTVAVAPEATSPNSRYRPIGLATAGPIILFEKRVPEHAWVGELGGADSRGLDFSRPHERSRLPADADSACERASRARERVRRQRPRGAGRR